MDGGGRNVRAVLLAVRINASLSSVQDINNNEFAELTTLPEKWRSKNYTVEFLNCINTVIESDLFSEIRNDAFHTMIIDESNDISVTKMLIVL